MSQKCFIRTFSSHWRRFERFPTCFIRKFPYISYRLWIIDYDIDHIKISFTSKMFYFMPRTSKISRIVWPLRSPTVYNFSRRMTHAVWLMSYESYPVFTSTMTIFDLLTCVGSKTVFPFSFFNSMTIFCKLCFIISTSFLTSKISFSFDLTFFCLFVQLS